jgi:PAS domain S-box-containing protein
MSEALSYDELATRLSVAEQTLGAIQRGEVDALVVSADGGPRIYTLDGADAFYRVLIEQMPVGAAAVRPDGSVLYANGAFADMLGLPLQSLIGGALRDFGRDERDRALLDDLLAAGRARSAGDLALRGPDRSIDVELSIQPVGPGGGDALCVVAVDVTERHEADAILRRTSEQLARSNADLEQFAHVIAHDLTEPLRTVSGFVQLLAERHGDQLSADAQEYIAFAAGGTRRMQEMLDGLLAYSRAGTAERTLQRVDCAHIVQRALSALQSSANDAGAQITVGELPEVVADPTQFEQLVQNLVGNALKFRGDAPARVEISATSGPEAHLFSVADHGIGVEPRHRERIFKMFNRLHSRDAHPGIGAGLAICRQLVVRNGGEIWLDETPGGGCTFRFTIPRVDCEPVV